MKFKNNAYNITRFLNQIWCTAQETETIVKIQDGGNCHTEFRKMSISLGHIAPPLRATTARWLSAHM